MKRIFTILVSLAIGILLTASVFAQSPEKMSYQAVIRNSTDQLVTDQGIGMQISILQSTLTGTAVFVETHNTTTNSNGLVSIEIGTGDVQSGDFTTIDWANDIYFIKTETDPTTAGGTTYSITGTSQLMSVPYALHAKTAESSIIDNVNDNDSDPNNEIQTISRTGTTVSLSNSGGTFQDSVGVYSAGTGIDISNNVISTSSGDCGLSIGDYYQEGIIFYLDASGCHGLICSTSDQSTNVHFYNGDLTDVQAFESCVGCGVGNTISIVYNQGDGAYAAQICSDLIIGTASEWYLPSKYELRLMYYNIGQGNALGLGNIGNFSNGNYWSSTEYGNDLHIWARSFGDGSQMLPFKSTLYYCVRAIKTF